VRARRALLALAAGFALVGRPAPAQSLPMNADRWTAAAGQFVERLQTGAYDAAANTVSPTVPAGAMSAPRLEQIWSQLTAQLGPLSALTPGSMAEQGELQVVDLRARFARSEVTVRVVLTREQKVAGLWVTPPAPPAYEPPAYVDTAAFSEAPVNVGTGPFALPGALTMPRGTAPVPVVVLVHGSGPSDRDETIGANRPFRDLAWGLASRGIGVLRYDKRTYVHPSQFAPRGPETVTPVVEVVDDALLALQAARANPRMASGRVFLLGHSLGAALAPEIARRDGALAGAVLLAPPARSAIDAVREQIAYLRTLSATGATAELDTAAAQVTRLERRELPRKAMVLGAPAGYWYDLAGRDPVAAARTLHVPMLVLHGGRDYQVTDADFARWREAFGGERRVTLRAYPELNHLFMPGSGRATPAEYTVRAGHVAAQVVEDVARWITSTPAP